MSWLDRIFGFNKIDISDILRKNPVILDVRRPYEFEAGHIEDAVHIPLYEIDRRIDEIRKMKRPVVAYCRSGMRSAQAVSVMKAHGIEAHDGGGMPNLARQLELVEG